MDEPRSWVLNLDAEDELAGLAPRAPVAALRQRFSSLRAQLTALVPAGDLVLGPGEPDAVARDSALGTRALCWCPTPRALETARRAGATLAPAPPPVVLRRVNHRAFCAALGAQLEGAVFATSLDAVHAALREHPAAAQWVLKAPLGYAGRGSRRFARGAWTEALERWVLALLARDGGVQLEPWVPRHGDFALHGFLSPAGRLWVGEPTVQEIAEARWQGSRRALESELAPKEVCALREALEQCAAALRETGYAGPFGIDAFRYESARGERLFRARCELNARYSMGWAVGMGALRPDL